ncbi:DNA-processing protein DprA [Undibacterium sp. SXout7W]|uniref:DNA-processing protein DprA n=1 Tax=Undibacterium sp. SXout7W TaxID=3413049 RepID=UPI003BF13681
MTSDLHDWLRLLQTAGVGPETARKLLAAFGLPEFIFAATPAQLSQVVSTRIAHALLAKPDDQLQRYLERCNDWCAQPGNHILTLADERYPGSLLNIPDPPALLYVKGQTRLLQADMLAVVGSRNATAQGVRDAEQFAETLSHAGLTISSGLAAGIDAAAHHGALRGIGSTVAVIGTGADIVYPARNRSLAHLIAEGGCIVSEYALGAPAIASHFPRRNRIISGLAKGVLVIEAAAQSGSLITARMAAEQGRDVFAIPGSIHAPLSKGCHQLIKQGAKLVDSAQDILDELEVRSPSLPLVPAESDLLTLPDNHLLSLLGYDPVHLDILASRADMDIASLSAGLLDLELSGQAEALPGGLYRRLV